MGTSANDARKSADKLGDVSNAADAADRFSVADIDKSIDPCVDFYDYACGNWVKNNPVPPDHPVWGSFQEIAEHNIAILRDLLEKASVNDPKRSSNPQKIGDFYASCMDEQAAERKGFSPIKPDLERIAAIKDRREMVELMARLEGRGAGAPFSFSSGADLHGSDMSIAFIDQGGLTLPDRDLYLGKDPRSASIREKYVEEMKRLFTLTGQSPEQSAHSAAAVLAIETEMAKGFADRAARRDPKVRDHKMSVAEIEALAPNFQLGVYFKAMHAPEFKELNVSNPDFFKTVDPVIASTPLDSWKAYMSWHLINNAADWLSADFVTQSFKLKQMLMGQQQNMSRWKRCVDETDNALGDALGQAYVEAAFGSDGKKRMLQMVDALETSLRQDITDLPWMTEATKKQALVKLSGIRNKIGFPDKWRDYSKVEIVRDDLVGNVFRTTQAEVDRIVQKIGKPVDKNDWIMTPPTVNAYYNSNYNEIVFPAGILQPPFFDRDMDDAVNFGAIGSIIGHELTHGFDDQGRQFDVNGNLHDWWTPQDSAEFDKRDACFVDEYNGFAVTDDVNVNGKLTVGENTADNGGARIAWMALQHAIAAAHDDPNKMRDGYTPEQRFFLGFARSWCSNTPPQFARMRAMMNPHPPGRWRTDGVVQNMPPFQKAFGCKAGQPMVRENPCRVW
jgi:predicted metalloendopeptidase